MKKYIIPLFIPHLGCPHQCVFCNQQKIIGSTTPVSQTDIRMEIAKHLAGIDRPYEIEAAFYGGSFTALPLKKQIELLTPAHEAWRAGRLHRIRLSTRPDCINDEILSMLAAHGVSIIELGVQSMCDNVLKAAERGHTRQDVLDAVKLIRGYEFKLGIQFMPGLPGDTMLSIMSTADDIIAIQPEMVRIYPTVVIVGTKLAVMYEQGEYQPLSLETAVKLCSVLKAQFERSSIQVIRTGLQSSESLDNSHNVLAGPYHPAFGEMTESYLFYLCMTNGLEKLTARDGKNIIIHHHSRDTSKVRGVRNANRDKLQRELPEYKIAFKADLEYQGRIAIETACGYYQTGKNCLNLV